MRLGLKALAAGFAAVLCAATTVAAQDFDQTTCDEFLLPQRTVEGMAGKKAGPASCLMQETDITFEGRQFRRLDIGVDGTVDGWVTTTGDYKEYLTNAPDLVFQQTADDGKRHLAIATYERDKGAAMTVIYPLDKKDWNGKMWVTVHGRGAAFKLGNLKPWNENLNRAKPLTDLNKYDKLMIAKGYVLVKTRRTTAEGLGEIKAVLDDGTTIDYPAFNDSHWMIRDFTLLAENAVAKRLGQAPARTYFYGHSAGARIGRGFNYIAGLNVGADGKPLFDGILPDDGAAGGWLPVVMTDGKDVLFTTDADRARFVPQLDVSHQNYNNIWPSKKPAYMSSSYLENKRNNARLLRDKGLTSKHRMYEVRSISHSGGEGYEDGRRGELQILDMSKLMDRFIDLLDAWVDKGVAPPPLRSDWAELGDVNKDGTIENPALAFPDVACPLGVYYPYPNSTAGATAFAAFTGGGDLEPLDGAGVFVDMNRNGVRDFRETPAQAWQRIGILAKGEALTREKYVACVTGAADALRRDGFFSDKTAQWYAEQARTAELEPKLAKAPTP